MAPGTLKNPEFWQKLEDSHPCWWPWVMANFIQPGSKQYGGVYHQTKFEKFISQVCAEGESGKVTKNLSFDIQFHSSKLVQHELEQIYRLLQHTKFILNWL